jgi:hypothetical protein
LLSAQKTSEKLQNFDFKTLNTFFKVSQIPEAKTESMKIESMKTESMKTESMKTESMKTDPKEPKEPKTKVAPSQIRERTDQEVDAIMQTRGAEEVATIISMMKSKVNPQMEQFAHNLLKGCYKYPISISNTQSGSDLQESSWIIPSMEQYIREAAEAPLPEILGTNLHGNLNTFLKYFNLYSGNYGNIFSDVFCELWWNKFIQPLLTGKTSKELTKGLAAAKRKYWSLVKAKRRYLAGSKTTSGTGKRMCLVEIIAKFIDTVKINDIFLKTKDTNIYSVLINALASQSHIQDYSNKESKIWSMFIPSEWFRYVANNHFGEAIHRLGGIVSRSEDWSHEDNVARMWKLRLNSTHTIAVLPALDADEPLTTEPFANILANIDIIGELYDRSEVALTQITPQLEATLSKGFTTKEKDYLRFLDELPEYTGGEITQDAVDLRLKFLLSMEREDLPLSEKINIEVLIKSVLVIRNYLKLVELLKFHKVRASAHKNGFFGALKPLFEKLQCLLPNSLSYYSAIAEMVSDLESSLRQKLTRVTHLLKIALNTHKSDVSWDLYFKNIDAVPTIPRYKEPKKPGWFPPINVHGPPRQGFLAIA